MWVLVILESRIFFISQKIIKKKKRKKVKLLSRVQLFATPWMVAFQAPLSMKFSKQEYRSGLPFPSSENLPNPGIEPGSPTLWADALPSEPSGKPQSFFFFPWKCCYSKILLKVLELLNRFKLSCIFNGTHFCSIF